MLPASARGGEPLTARNIRQRCRSSVQPAGPEGPGALANRLQGQSRAGEFLGELVPALYLRNARTGTAEKTTGTQILLDTSKDTFNAWGVETLPTTFLVDADGRIRYSVLGNPDWQDPTTIAIVEKLLPENAQTPADNSTVTDNETNR